MKCENCGKNEVTFVYRSNINGKIEEKHLCGECAEKLGYSRKIAAQSRRMMQGMQNFFSDGFSPFGGALSGFFAPEENFFGEDLLDGFFSEMPALGAESEQTPKDRIPVSHEIPISGEEKSRFSRMRRLNQLRLELKRAVREENFEHAAELRDEIHAMEDEKKS